MEVFGAKDLCFFINEVESAIGKSENNLIIKKINAFDNELKELIKKNSLIIEAANKFLIDEGQAIQASSLLKKIDQSNTLEELKEDIYQNYILVNLKEKIKRYIPLIKELSSPQGKNIECKFSGDDILINQEDYSPLINTMIHIFRNIVDHGVESEDERLEKQKPTKGILKVQLKRRRIFLQ